MGCELQGRGKEVYAVLSFHREELLYDIKNLAYIEGSVMSPDTPDHNRHMVQDVGEEGNVDRVTRILEISVARTREQLYPFTKYGMTRRELEDRLREQRIYGIVLSVPEDFSQTTLNLLEHLVHELLVCRVMEEWMRLTNPGKADIWKERIEETEREIKRSLTNRNRKLRIRQHFLN